MGSASADQSGRSLHCACRSRSRRDRPDHRLRILLRSAVEYQPRVREAARRVARQRAATQLHRAGIDTDWLHTQRQRRRISAMDDDRHTEALDDVIEARRTTAAATARTGDGHRHYRRSGRTIIPLCGIHRRDRSRATTGEEVVKTAVPVPSTVTVLNAVVTVEERDSARGQGVPAVCAVTIAVKLTLAASGYVGRSSARQRRRCQDRRDRAIVGSDVLGA